MSFEVTRDENYRFEPLPDPSGTKPESENEKKNDKLILTSTNQFTNEPREFVIGDLHFYDPNIIQYAQRNFSSVEEMNAYMLEQWNSVVTIYDDVFVLGDFFDCGHCDYDQIVEILNQLNGHKILIAGNHDVPFLDFYRKCDIEVVEYPIIKDEFWFLSHEPMFVTEAAPYANIFAHVHTNPMYKTVSSRSFCVSAERHDYTPVLLSEVKRMVRECASLEIALRESDNVEIN